jgi:hypothetical protein
VPGSECRRIVHFKGMVCHGITRCSDDD